MGEAFIISIAIAGILIQLFLLYYIIKIAVYYGVKKALKQQEYYLEIIAKEVFDRQQKN